MNAIAAAPHFWAAVEDCLVTFHQLARCDAAEKVTSLLRRLPVALDNSDSELSGMIYHAEPWQIACNLADKDLPVGSHQAEYQSLLVRNGLASG